MRYIDHQTIGDRLTWAGVVDTLRAGHTLPRAEISDQFLTRGPDTMLSRAAWIDGLGIGVKTVSVMAGNAAKGLPTVHGGMLVFEDQNGTPEAVVDSQLVTEWKTAGDSVLGATILARPDAAHYLIIGAGVVAENLVRAYCATFPGLTDVTIWNRSADKATRLAQKMAAQGYPTTATGDLPTACAQADIISTATMAQSPVLQGDWVTPGTHVDLIGAFKPDMREADDVLLQKAQVYVDCFDTTLDHIGEMMIPLANGTLTRDDVLGDLYDLVPKQVVRKSDAAITVFKNGGGAHLDLMTARHILAMSA